MSLVSSRHFQATSFIDSFHSSLSEFHSHGIPLALFRYTHVSSSSSFKHQNSNFCSLTQNSITYHSTNKQCHPTNGNRRNCIDVKTSSSSNWLEKWKKPHQRLSRNSPRPVLNYRASMSGGGSIVLDSSGAGGDGGGSTMDKIVEKLKKFGYREEGIENEKSEVQERAIEKGSVEDMFYIEEGMLPDTRGGFSSDSLLGLDHEFKGNGDVRFPWEKPAVKLEEAENSVKRRSRTFMAELTLPESELRRLKNLTLKTKQKVKIGGAGVTQAVVDAIHEKWKSAEIVRLKVEGAPALNMKRVHEILERKTGGLVIWRSGTSISLYRGVSYEVPSVELKKWTSKKKGAMTNVSSMHDQRQKNPVQDNSYGSISLSREGVQKTSDERKDSESLDRKYEDEINNLLSDLGPRYTDWPGGDPLPIDADLLPNVVPGFQAPFRLLPYGVRPTLGRNEATALKRIARSLPPHFALGRGKQLEGLAAAIVKLWERSSIVKVALKRGVQLTTSERMAEEIKRLTGGILLSRNKDFLVFYRGKNFLSPDVTEALLERERLAKALQDKEEQARIKASASVMPGFDTKQHQVAAGTLCETLDANAKWAKRIDDHEKEKMLREAEVISHANLVRKLEKKLAFAERKLCKAEQTLSKVEEFLNPADRQPDPYSITDEERFMFRKLGLRMKAFLLLGRRGVFDGTVENMHLHWKYRELVKIIVKAKNFEDVKQVALSLEAESGGILVSVDKISKGYAIIEYRGKNYQRPATLRPKNLLTKRKALARSIELQRREGLLKHIAQVQQNVEKLRSEIEQMDVMNDQRDADFYDSLDAAYPTEDEDTEDEDDEAYLETYDDESDEDEGQSSFKSFHPETENVYHPQSQGSEGVVADIEGKKKIDGKYILLDCDFSNHVVKLSVAPRLRIAPPSGLRM